MASVHDIVVELRATDKGLKASLIDAATQVNQVAAAAGRAGRKFQQEFGADRFAKMAAAQREIVAEHKKAAQAIVEIGKKQKGLNQDQQIELNTLKRLIDERSRLAATYGKIATLRNQDNQFAESQFQLAKKLSGAQAQIAQAVSAEVTQLRNTLGFHKARQDNAVRMAALTNQQLQAESREVAIKAQIVSLETQEAVAKDANVAKQRIKTALAKEEQDALVRQAVTEQQAARAAQQLAAAQGVLSGKMKLLVGSLLVAGGALKVMAGSLRALTPIAVGAGKAFGVGLVKSLQVLINIARSVITTMGKMGRAVGQAAANIARATGSFLSATRAKQKYREATGQVADAEGWHSRSLKGLVGNVVNVNRWINTLGSSVRQLGQAFQNAGTTFSIFVSLPLTMFGRGLFDTAVDFNSQLIEIRKNADLMLDGLTEDQFDLKKLDQQLRDIASVSPTKITDIGEMAVDAAKLGLDPTVIAPFVKAMDMFVVSTDVAADDAVDNMGRIMSIFYDMSSSGIVGNAKEFEKTVYGIASAINEVGQANPIGEGDVIATLLRMAPAARALNMSIADAIGLSASVASASASAERAGTQLGTALNMTAQNLEDIAHAGGMSVEALREFADLDITSAVVGIAEAISKIESPLERAAALQELYGAIGGKAMGIFSASVPNTVENIAIANAAFEEGLSIVREFDRAMDSVANQMGLLRNQFDLIGLSLGDALLPALTDVLSYLVPLMQAVAKGFNSLSESTKMWIVGVMLALAVLGPLLVALGSIMFSIGILTTGLTGLFTVFGKILVIPLTLAGMLLGLLSPFKLIVVAASLAALAMLGFGGVIGDLGQMVVDFAQGMYYWGFNAFTGFADGIEAAGQYVVDVVVAILTTIRAMLEAFSPPKEGPLRNIDVWGKNIAQTFADGFLRADLTPVRTFAGMIAGITEDMVRGLTGNSLNLYGQVSSVISSAISSLGGFAGMESDEVGANTIGGLEAFVGVLNAMQNGAAGLGAAFANLSHYTGAFSSDIQRLINLQNEYNLGQERLEEIQERLSNFDRETDAQVKAIAARKDLSVRERIALIRQARIAASIRKTQLQDEQRMAEIQQQNIQEQIDLQKQLIDVFKDLLQNNAGNNGSADAIDDVADSTEKLDDRVDGLEYNLEGMQDRISEATDTMKEKFAGLNGDLGRFVQSMSSAREQLKGFLDAILGKDRPSGEVTPDYLIGWDTGWAMRDKYLGWLGGVKLGWDGIKSSGLWLSSALGAVAAGFKLAFGDKTAMDDIKSYNEILGPLAQKLYSFGLQLGFAAKTLGEYGTIASDVFRELVGAQDGESTFDILIRKFGEFRDAFVKAFGNENPAVKNVYLLLAPFGGIALLLSAIAGLTFDNLGTLGEILGMIGNKLTALWGVAGAVAVIAASFAGMDQGGLRKLLEDNLELIGSGALTDVIQDALALGNPSDPIGKQIVDYISKQIQAADWSKIASDLAGAINSALFGQTTYSGFLTGPGVSSNSGGLANMIDVSVISTALTGVVEAITSFIAALHIGSFGVKIVEEFNKITEDLKTVDFDAAAENIGIALSDSLGKIKFEDVTAVISNFLNGIVAGLRAGIEDKSLDAALKSFVAALIEGLANIRWVDIVDTVKVLVIKLLEAIRDAPWDKLANEIKDLLTALLEALADPKLWYALAGAVTVLATRLMEAITGADWGALFNKDTMRGIAEAIGNGIRDALKSVIPGLFPEDSASASAAAATPVDNSAWGDFAEGVEWANEAASGFADTLNSLSNPLQVGASIAANVTPLGGAIADYQDAMGEANLTGWQMLVDSLGSNGAYQADMFGVGDNPPASFNIDWESIFGSQPPPPQLPDSELGVPFEPFDFGGWFSDMLGGAASSASSAGATVFDAFFGGFVPMSANAAPLESGVQGMQDFSMYGQQIAQAALQLQPMHTAQTYQEWISAQEDMSSSVQQQTGGYLSFLPMVSNASTLTQGATTGLQTVGLGLQKLQTVSTQYGQQMDAVMPVLTSLASGVSSTTGTELTTAIGAMLGAGIYSGIAKYALESGGDMLDFIKVGYVLWMVKNLEAIRQGGSALANQIYFGVSTFISENITRFDVITETLASWVTGAQERINSSGIEIGDITVAGFQEVLVDPNNFNVIADAFDEYVQSIDSSSSIVTNARRLGRKIVEAIGDKIEDEYGIITESIENAIRQALREVNVGDGTVRSGGPVSRPSSVGTDLSSLVSQEYASGPRGDIIININGPINASSKSDVVKMTDELYREFSSRMARESRVNRRY